LVWGHSQDFEVKIRRMICKEERKDDPTTCA
jgi:hypothetical protein